LGAEVSVGGGLDGRHVRIAGVVDDHVEAAEAAAGLGDGRGGGGRVGDVEGDGVDAVAQRFELGS
jgi:hypothetical protein